MGWAGSPRGWMLWLSTSRPPHSAYTTPPASANAFIPARKSLFSASSAACCSG